MIRERLTTAMQLDGPARVAVECARPAAPAAGVLVGVAAVKSSALPGGRATVLSGEPVSSGDPLAQRAPAMRPPAKPGAAGTFLTPTPQARTPRRGAARGFTLVELLITISIIGIMATMVLFAMFQAQETAKEHRTRALITKLNTIVMRKYDEYQTRRVPYVFPSASPTASAAARKQAQQVLAKARVDCLRDLMRLEMPDRWSDVIDNPVAPFVHTLPASLLGPFTTRIDRPAVSQAYLRKYNVLGTATTEHQGAECLYMIVMEAIAQDGGNDTFKPADIADLDNDGFPEFVDAWRRPIQFIRWAPGYQSPLQTPIRIEGQITQDSAQKATVRVTGNNGPRLSQTPGSYVGGTIAMIHNTTQLINTQYMARITGYNYDAAVSPPVVRFTCEMKDTGLSPFQGDTLSGNFVVMQPDPFDSRGVYPIYPTDATLPSPDTTIPTFALYPLIFSKGRDLAGGLVDDVKGGAMVTMQYADPSVGLNPFFIPPPLSEPFGLQIGAAVHKDSDEPGWYYGCHNDNITNHVLSTR